jgi:hypothetical protein
MFLLMTHTTEEGVGWQFFQKLEMTKAEKNLADAVEAKTQLTFLYRHLLFAVLEPQNRVLWIFAVSAPGVLSQHPFSFGTASLPLLSVHPSDVK